MNDRALRQITVSLGGLGNGFPREDGFDITRRVRSHGHLLPGGRPRGPAAPPQQHRRGQDPRPKTVTAGDLDAAGAMTALLRDAFKPNLVQTLEQNPAVIHGGPFANIAHGCSSMIATKTALKLADYVITEAGFGADLGAEKFFDIKCRKGGLKPAAAVIVATVRALKMHGGVALADLGTENVDALRKGCKNLLQHIRNVRSFGVPVVVAANRFVSDTDAEIAALEQAVAEAGAKAIPCTHWSDGGAGAEALAREVVELCENGHSQFAPLYSDDMPLWDKAQTIAKEIYGASEITADTKVRNRFKQLEREGYGHFPVCMAKTQYSFSTDPKLLRAPKGHSVQIREVRLAAGAEFIVAVCGDIMTMPGLPRVPAANSIDLDAKGQIEGLF